MATKTTITDLVCKNAKAADKRYEIADATRQGFRLSVQPSGAKSLILRYTHAGEYRNMTLAPYTPGGNALKIALAAYAKAQDALAAGTDPKAALRPKADPDAALTTHIANFKRLKVATLRASTQDYVKRSLDRLDTKFSGRELRAVKKSELVKWLDEIADAHGVSAAISHWKVIRCFFRWVESREDDFANPAAALAAPGKDREGDRTLSDAELRAVWNAALKVGGATGRFVRLMILTGCRRHEITHLARSEIVGNEIVIPKTRYKTHRELRLPITAAMRRVLDECPKEGPFAINGAHALGDHSGMKEKIDEHAKIEAWRFHDLRHSVETGMARIGISPFIADAITHPGGSMRGSMRRYQHHDFTAEKRAALERWSEHIEAITSGAKIKAAA